MSKISARKPDEILKNRRKRAVSHVCDCGTWFRMSDEQRLLIIGIVVAVLNQVLSRAGRDEQAMMTTLAGLVVVLMMVVREIADLFQLVKTLFHL